MGRTEFTDFLDKKFGRTEGQILKDFEKLKYVVYNSDEKLELICWLDKIEIDKKDKTIQTSDCFGITLVEFKLLNELFKIWGWL